MIDVHWLEQTEADVPAENDWLSAAESLRMNAMRFAKRRIDWRLGRWTAKRAWAAYLSLPSNPRTFADIEVRAVPSGAPEVFIANKAAAITISLSHRGGIAACAVAQSGAELGCDLEIVEPRTDAFVTDYFAAEEHSLIERTCAPDRPRLLALLWSAKESALKALRTGLRLDTRSVIVHPGHPSPGDDDAHQGESSFDFGLGSHRSWRPLYVVYEDGRIFCGWWHNTGDLVRTMVACPSPNPPIPLEVPTHPATSAS